MVCSNRLRVLPRCQALWGFSGFSCGFARFAVSGLLFMSVATYAVADGVGPVRPTARPDGSVSTAIMVPMPAVAVGQAGPSVTDRGTTDLTPRVRLNRDDLSPPARTAHLPRTRFQHQPGHALWTRAALSALKTHGKPLVDMVPADITEWCPAYPAADEKSRRAFWVGFLSALSKHESTYKAYAVGGGGLWYGLLQILPSTARGYDCNAGTGEALKSGAANLSCAIRIMAVTVPRDGVVYGPGGRGVAADWGPLRSATKRADIARWLRRQNYCKPLDATRPKTRP
jgi:hypothetical protein